MRLLSRFFDIALLAITKTMLRQVLLPKVLLLYLCVLGVQPVAAKPTIEGFDLVNSVRISRAVFDYSYRVRIQGDAYTYTGVVVTVMTKKPISGTTVTKSTVSVDKLDAGAFIFTSDTFTVRQDRTVAFDPSNISLVFSGVAQSNASTAGFAQVGAVTFVETSGRPGHEGSFPIQGSDPTAGGLFGIMANVFGAPTNVSFQLIGNSGNVLAQGVMLNEDKFIYIAPVTIPNVPFNLSITATGSNGSTSNWTSSRLYNPPAYTLSIVPSTAILDTHAPVPLALVVNSTGASGTYNLSLTLPAGFSAGQTSWAVNIGAGQGIQVSTTLTAPPNGPHYQRYTLVATITSKINPQDFTQSILKVMVP